MSSYKAKHKDARTWRQRFERMDRNWKDTIPGLVDAYIAWSNSSAATSDEGVVLPDDALGKFDIDVLDIYSLRSSATITPTSESMSTAAMLVACGYLGTTPVNPSLAISLKTLELLRRLRLFKASFSIEAFAKLLCYCYKVRKPAPFATVPNVLRHIAPVSPTLSHRPV